MKKKYFWSLLFMGFLLGIPSAMAQYCVPSYSSGCYLGDYIDDFIITDNSNNTILSHLGTGCSTNDYGDYTGNTALQFQLDKNTTYNFEASFGTSSDYLAIWIDLNNDGDFSDSGEMLFQSTSGGSSSTPLTSSFTVPNIAGIITTRMRVMVEWFGAPTDPCSPGSSYGEVHDYQVTLVGENPNCFSPKNLALISASPANGAEFSWDSVSAATNGYRWLVMNSGDDPNTGTPVQSDTVPSGTTSVTVTSLATNTYYDFYVRSECSATEQSIWRSVSFVITKKGAVCSNPFEVDSLPYTDVQNTGDFIDNISGVPGTGCGTTEAYLDGNDVIYKYTADKDYVITVTLDSLSDPYVGAFVYEACDSIGIACPTSGIAAGNIMDSQSFEFLAEQGHDYYIVISSAAMTDSLSYHLSIDGYDCSEVPAPTGYAYPYFLQGDSLEMLAIEGSKFNEDFKWYSDSLLTSPLPDGTIVQDSTVYYVTQTVMGCESAPLKVTPQLFKCSALDPVVVNDTVQICIPGGLVTLQAETSPAGNGLRWYTSQTGGEAVSDEKNYDAGFISQTTTFWVSEARVIYDNATGQAKLTHTGTANTSLSDYGLAFDADEAFTIKDVEVYSAGSGGDITVQLQDDNGGMIAQKSFTIPSGSSSSPVAVTLPLDFEVPGPGSYYLVKTSSGVDMIRDYSSGNNFPYAIGSYGEVTSGVSSFGTSTSYYWFYNWTVSNDSIICESPREKVVVEVSSDIPKAPEVESPYIFCGSQQEYTLADIQVSGVDLHWYDQYGTELGLGTKLVDGETYFVLDKGSGACVSDIARVEVIIREVSALPQGDTIQMFQTGQMLYHLDVNGDNLKWYADAQRQQPLPITTPLVDSTTYYVTQQEAGACESDALGILVMKGLGVDEVNLAQLQLYPNPVESVLQVSCGLEITAVQLYDLSGRQLQVQLLNRMDSGLKLELDFSGYAAGTYFLRIVTDRGAKTLQVIKK